jgi:hypothetical protein
LDRRAKMVYWSVVALNEACLTPVLFYLKSGQTQCSWEIVAGRYAVGKASITHKPLSTAFLIYLFFQRLLTISGCLIRNAISSNISIL